MKKDVIKSNDLEIAYFYRNEKDKLKKIRAYIVVCRCGNEKLMLASVVVRCHVCGRGHDYETYLKYKMQADRYARFGEGRRGRLKQFKPMPAGNPELIDVKTGKRTKISLAKYWDIINKKIPKDFVCPKCKKTIAWTAQHYFSGIAPPIITINNEETCFPCARKKFLSD